MKDIGIEYYGGSGFLVSAGTYGFLFDVSPEGEDKRILPEKDRLSSFEHLFVFVSHHHDDHFSPVIYNLCGEDATYILGFDIPEPYRGIRMKRGEENVLGNVTIHAYGSTDEGVSFLVTYAGIVLFHAGDLNLWHWRDSSTVSEIEAAEHSFYDCVSEIPVQKIDVAFFPVDPRQGSLYDAGAGYFVMTVKPRVLIPMHFQGRPEAAIRFSVKGETPFTKIAVMENPGDHINLLIPETEDSSPDQKLRNFIEN